MAASWSILPSARRCMRWHPKLQEIEQQNAELRQRLAKEARRRLDQAVELAVPNYREIDRDPRWHRWLLGIDVLSGRVRQQLLNEAIAAARPYA